MDIFQSFYLRGYILNRNRFSCGDKQCVCGFGNGRIAHILLKVGQHPPRYYLRKKTKKVEQKT